MEFLRKLWSDEEGQGMVEYVLLIAVIVVIAIFLGPKLGTFISGLFTDITTDVGTIKAQ